MRDWTATLKPFILGFILHFCADRFGKPTIGQSVCNCNGWSFTMKLIDQQYFSLEYPPISTWIQYRHAGTHYFIVWRCRKLHQVIFLKQRITKGRNSRIATCCDDVWNTVTHQLRVDVLDQGGMLFIQAFIGEILDKVWSNLMFVFFSDIATKFIANVDIGLGHPTTNCF